MAQAVSTRWYPTPEQLTILRTMYRGGVRSLGGSQIQQMVAYLSLYGKIEAKNVFYWFQNRKARDRQKLRRRLTKQHTKTASSAAHVLLQQQSFNPQVQTWTFAHSHPLRHQAQGFSVSQGGYGTTQVVNGLVFNLEAFKRTCEAGKEKMARSEDGWIQIMDLDTKIKPVETLELFPTNNGDLK